MKKVKFSKIFIFNEKSKIKAGEGLNFTDGVYPFYTSSSILSKSLNTYQFEDDSLIFGTGGKASVHFENKKFSVSTDCFSVYAKEKTKTFTKYVFYYFIKNIHILEEGFRGAGLKHISKKYIEDLEIPLPPLSQQKAIAAQLDKAQELIQYNEQLIEKYDELQQSLFLDMFGDPILNEKGWEMVKLGVITEVYSGSTPSRKNGDYFNGNIPWIKTGEVNGTIIKDTSEKITEVALRESSCRLYPKGSLIIAMYGQGKTRGQIGMLGIEATTNQACAVLLPTDKMNYTFLMSLLKLSYEDLRELGRGGNQPNLNIGIVKSYSVLSPPLYLQTEFASHIESIELQKEQAKEALAKSKDIFQGLLQEHFSN